jgi:integrase/recombinase XerD
VTDNLPVRIVEPNDRAKRLAETFATSARADGTIAARRRDLIGPMCSPRRGSRPARTLAWLEWCSANGVDPLGVVRPAHVLAWVANLRDFGDAESTRNRRLSTVSAWYRWLRREEVVRSNPAAALLAPEKPKSAKSIYSMSPTPAPSREQAKAMQRAADSCGVQAGALFALLATSGARASELCSADVEDIGQDRGHPVLTLTVKGGRKRVVPLPPSVFRRVQAMIDARTADEDRLPATTAGARPRRALLTQVRTGNRMTRHDVTRIVKRIGRLAGLDDLGFTPHSMRGAYITDLLDDGVSLRDVQKDVGHASPDTTTRYDHSLLNLDRHPAYRRAAQLADDGPTPVTTTNEEQ